MPHLRDAVLDAVEASAELVESFATRVAETLTDEIHAVVVVAARAKATEADVRAAIDRVRLRRAAILAALDVARDAERLGARVERTLRAAAGQGPGRRGPPIRKRDLDERRARRGDSALVRFDRIEDVPEGDVPELEALAGRSEAELLALLRSRGVSFDPDGEFVTQIERATKRLLGADRPDDALVERVIRNAQSAARGSLLRLAKSTVREARVIPLERGREINARWLWVAVLDDRTCESCDERHNESRTMAEWEQEGKPGSANLLCNGNCRCELLPDDLYEPALREGPGDVEVDLTATTTRD